MNVVKFYKNGIFGASIFSMNMAIFRDFFLNSSPLHPFILLNIDLWYQDVLIPWHKPAPSSSADEKTGDRDTTTTTCTSEDDVTHYHAYTQTGTSDSEPGHNSGMSPCVYF